MTTRAPERVDRHPLPAGAAPGRTREPELRHLARRAVLAVVVLLVAAVLVFDVVKVVAVHRAEHTLAVTDRQLATTRAALVGASARLVSAAARLQSLEHNDGLVVSEVHSINGEIDGLNQHGAIDSLDILALDTCLSGVTEAINAINAAQPAGVLSAVTAVSTTCLSLDSTSGGLVYPFNFPDPSVLQVGSEYYAFSTNAVVGNVQVITSSNLTQWTPIGDALPQLPAWAAAGDTWHPSVLRLGGSFVMFYAVADAASGMECVSEAVATQPQGPYVDTSTAPLVCQTGDGGSLDPSPYIGADGQPYLVWKSQGTTGQPPALWAQQLTPTGTALAAGQPSELLTPDQAWEGGIIEGPDMVVVGGEYLLLFGGNNWRTADYGIGYAVCQGPLGPCTASGADPLLASDQSMEGPGGPSVFTGPDGRLWLAFHAWLPGQVDYPNGRPLFLRQLTVTNGVPVVQP